MRQKVILLVLPFLFILGIIVQLKPDGGLGGIAVDPWRLSIIVEMTRTMTK